MTVPESYWVECHMVAPVGDALTKEELLDDISTAYILTAESISECNIIRKNGLELQRRMADRFDTDK